MARPKIEEEARRTETLAFRMTPVERMQIEHHAIEAGLSASEYVRMQALRGQVVVQKKRGLDPAVFDELRRIGVNLNQLARRANQTGRISAGLTAALASLEQILVRDIDDSGRAVRAQRGHRSAGPAGMAGPRGP